MREGGRKEGWKAGGKEHNTAERGGGGRWMEGGTESFRPNHRRHFTDKDMEDMKKQSMFCLIASVQSWARE